METSSPKSTEGLVVQSTGSWYDVRVGDRIVPSRLRGKFRLDETEETNPLAVGDRVEMEIGEDGTGIIHTILPRTNQLSRRAAGRRIGLEQVIAANVDRAWCVQSVAMPGLNPGLVDRFLVAAEYSEIPAGIVVNKYDLLEEGMEAYVEAFVELYDALGYPVVLTSTLTEEGVEEFRGALKDQVSVVSGQSGVGKSSLLNAVAPGLQLRTGEVSKKTRKGKHTTTNAALHPLPFGGYVVDTPGIREFGITALDPADLGHQFVEFRPYLQQCRFLPCTHDHEPGCAVKAAAEREEISLSRYNSYLNILDSLRLGAKDVGR